MALFNKDKKENKSIAEKKTADLAVRAKTSSSQSSYLPKAIKTSHLTEKASNLAAQNKFVFAIERDVNKLTVAKEIKAKFGVDVEAVNIINLPDKQRRKGNIIGRKQGVRKAIVTIKQGQTIEIQ